MVDLRKRGQSSNASLNTTKRARIQLENHGDELSASCFYERSQGVRFPPEMEALTHVLDQVDSFLMTREEAVVEAARSGQVAWLKQLIDRDDECTEVLTALVAAAGNSRVECVDELLNKYFNPERGGHRYWQRHCHPIILEAVETASVKGHRSVLESLLREQFYYSRLDASLAAGEALDAAAANGHLDVVRFVVEHMKKHKYVTTKLSLSRPISAGHSSVVEFLLGLDVPSWWDLVGAFAAAVNAGQAALADRILGIYYAHTAESDTPLLIQLTSRGSTNAVEYLYACGDNQPLLVSKAFERAAMLGYMNTMEFLLRTGLVSSAAFNRAFERAATKLSPDTLAFLYSKQRASPTSINRAFKASSNSKMVQYLYENAAVSRAAVIAAFKKAARCGESFWLPCFNRNEIAIVKLLHEDDRIPAKAMGEALVSAARKNNLELVKVLRADPRISVEMTRLAFLETSSSIVFDVMKALYDEQRIPAEVVIAAFRQAASWREAAMIARTSRCRFDKMKQLLKFLPSDVVHQQGLDAELAAKEAAVNSQSRR